jgi:hypothetical protein
MRANPSRLNALQLKTLAILQALARERGFAHPPDADGTVLIHTLPMPMATTSTSGARWCWRAMRPGSRTPTS